MNKEEYVTYEQALKLKELGFKEKCNHFYGKEEGDKKEVELIENIPDYDDFYGGIFSDGDVTAYEDFNSGNYSGIKIYCSAPTLWQVQKWLLEKRIVIFALMHGPNLNEWEYKFKFYNLNDVLMTCCDGKRYLTYEKALSAGIDEGIKHLEYEQAGI